MAELTLYKDTCVDFTVVSNLFIDQYMKDANDAQLKVYLYLIRMLSAGKATSVSDIADKFNHTEKDVMRSLKYWEKQGVLSLEYDQNKTLTGIRLCNLTNGQNPAGSMPQAKPLLLSTDSNAPFGFPAGIVLQSQNVLYQQEPVQEAPAAAPRQEMPETVKEQEPAAFVKPAYTSEQLREFKSRETTDELLFVAEQYIGKPLTPSEMKTILFFSDELHFSMELIDYLLQYCVDRNKKDFKYIEKVAINWAMEGITTPKQAQRSAGKYDKNVYMIMNELGKTGSPTDKEMEFIRRWLKEYAFSMDIITEACQRTVLATDRHRFEYAEGILKSWHQENVRHKSDISRIDEMHQKKRTSYKPSSAGNSNKFNQFTQNDYDFSDLEKKLISN